MPYELYNARNHTQIRKHIKKTGAFDLINNVLFLGIGCCMTAIGNYDADKNCGPNSIGATKAFLTLFSLGAAGSMVYQYYMHRNVMQNFNKTHNFSTPNTSSTTFNSLSQKLNPTQNSEQAQEYDEL